jgi:hypothetical protein
MKEFLAHLDHEDAKGHEELETRKRERGAQLQLRVFRA